MRNVWLVLFGLVLVSGAAFADRLIKLNDNLTIVVPAASPLHYTSYDKNEIIARFAGAFVLSGTWHVTVAGAEASDYADPWFEPDKASLATLPYWQSYTLKATHITFGNGNDFARAVVPAAELATRGRGKPRTLSGPVTIKLDHFEMNITCDYPYYSAHFLSVVRPAQLLARRTGADEEGC